MTNRFCKLKISFVGLLLAPLLLSADIEYRGKVAGDEAFRNGDYSTAASFYEQYQKAAHADGNAADEKTAYERRIDALVLGKFPDAAEKLLQEYKRKFPGSDSVAVTIWTSDILLMQNKPEEASRKLERILSALTADNPRTAHALYSLARSYELSGKFAKAAGVYFKVGQVEPSGFFGKNNQATKLQIAAWEQGVYCQILIPLPKSAAQSLAKHPGAKDPAYQNRIQLLQTFLAVKTGPEKDIPSVWKKYKLVENYSDNLLAYPIFSMIGDIAGKSGYYHVAAEAYAAAYNSSPGKEEAFNTLNRLLLVIHASGDKKAASDLAVNTMKLFKGRYISVKFLEEVAGVLMDSGRLQESAEFYTELVENPAVSDRSKDHAMKCLTQMSARIKLPEKSLKQLDSYFKGTKAGDRQYIYAETKLKDKKYAEAAVVFQQVAQKFQKWRQQAYYQAAYCRLMLKEYQNVLDILNLFFRTVGTGKMYTDAIYLKARSLEGLDRKEDAKKEYEKYSNASYRTDIYVVESLYRGGRLAFLLGENYSALRMFERLIREYPRVPKALDAANWRVYIYRSSGDDYRADRATYEMAYTWPDSQITFNAMYELAEHNISTDSYYKVMEVFDDLYRKTNVAGNKERVLIGKVSLAVYHKKYADAKEFLDLLERDFPENRFKAKASYLRGHVLQAAGDYKQALDFYKKVLEMKADRYLINAANGSIGDCLFILAGKSQTEAAYTEALQAYMKIMESPNLDAGLEAMTLYKIGRTVELQTKDDDKAVEYYKRALYLPAAFNTPASRLWAAKAAEAIYSVAEKKPSKQNIENAENALNILEKYQIIPKGTAERRADVLRRARFRPRKSK